MYIYIYIHPFFYPPPFVSATGLLGRGPGLLPDVELLSGPMAALAGEPTITTTISSITMVITIINNTNSNSNNYPDVELL